VSAVVYYNPAGVLFAARGIVCAGDSVDSAKGEDADYRSLLCMLELYRKTQDYSICDRTSNQSLRDRCISNFATIQAKPSHLDACNKIGNASKKHVCISSIAYSLSNITACELIEDPIQSEFCRLLIERDKLNVTFSIEYCKNTYKNPTNRDNCFSWTAAQQQDSNFCSHIGNQTTMNKCLHYISYQDFGSIEDCNKIIISSEEDHIIMEDCCENLRDIEERKKCQDDLTPYTG
jgi:hypothetical protein